MTIVGIPLSASAGTIGSVPPERSSSGRAPSARSKASWPSRIAAESGGISPGGADDQRSTSTSAPAGRRLAQQPLDLGHDLLRPLARREPDREVRLGDDRDHRLLELRRAALDAVHVDRRLGPRADVELLGGRSRPSAWRPGPASTSAPGVLRRPVGELLGGRRDDALAQRLRQAPVRPGSTPESACVSACVAYSAAPPNVPEWRSRSPVRDLDVEVADARAWRRRTRAARAWACARRRSRRRPRRARPRRSSRRSSGRRPPPRRRRRCGRSRAARPRRRAAPPPSAGGRAGPCRRRRRGQ